MHCVLKSKNQNVAEIEVPNLRERTFEDWDTECTYFTAWNGTVS